MENSPAEFEKKKWLQYRLDYGWRTRVDKKAPTYCCLNTLGEWWEDCLDEETCRSGTWKVRTPGYEKALYSGLPVADPKAFVAPELTKRIDANAVPVPASLACEVAEVVATKTGKRIDCAGDETAKWHINVTGMLAVLHIGDVVQVPLKDVQRDPNGVLFKEVTGRSVEWVLGADAASVKVDPPATCPTNAEILAGANGPAKGPTK